MTAPVRRRTDDMPAIEGVRAIAALGIVVFHLWQNGYRVVDGHVVLAYGSTRAGLAAFFTLTAGVPIFFALSGLLLARPFLRRALLADGLPDMKDWVRRRACRILPLYLFLVVGIWSSRNYRWPGDWRDLLEHLTFTQDLDGKRIFYTLGPGWSMASEVKFYFLLAGLAWFWVRVAKRVRARGLRLFVIATPIVMLYVFSMAFKWLVFTHWGISAYSFQWSYSFPVRLDGFCVGMMLALWSAHRDAVDAPVWRPWTAVWVPISVAAMYYGGWIRSGGTEERAVWVYPLMALAAAPMLMTLTACRTSVIARGLSYGPLVKLGLMTYSVYLLHEPVLEQLSHWGLASGLQSDFLWQMPLLLAASLFCAAVCHFAIERPGLLLLNMWDRHGKREYYHHLVEIPVQPYPSAYLALVPAGSLGRSR